MYFIYIQFVIAAYLLTYLWQNMKYTKGYILLLVSVIFMHLMILFAFIRADHFTYYHFFWEYL